MFSIYYIPTHIEIPRHPGETTSKFRKRAVKTFKEEIQKIKKLDDKELIAYFKRVYKGT